MFKWYIDDYKRGTISSNVGEIIHKQLERAIATKGKDVLIKLISKPFWFTGYFRTFIREAFAQENLYDEKTNIEHWVRYSLKGFSRNKETFNLMSNAMDECLIDLEASLEKKVMSENFKIYDKGNEAGLIDALAYKEKNHEAINLFEKYLLK